MIKIVYLCGNPVSKRLGVRTSRGASAGNAIATHGKADCVSHPKDFRP